MSRINSKTIEIAQWIAVTGMFFMNRIEAATSLFAAFLIINYKKGKTSTSLLLPLIFWFIYNILLIKSIQYDIEKCIQQFILISIFILSYEQVFRNARKNPELIFLKYVRVTYYISLIGLFQEICYVALNINICDCFGYHSTQPLFGFMMRVTSTLSEGGYLGTVLIPSIIYLFYYNDPTHVLGKKKYWILLVGLLSMSPFVYLTVTIIFTIKFYKKFPKIKYLIGICIAVIVYQSYQGIMNGEYKRESGGINGIFMRVKESVNMVTLFSSDEVLQLSQYNTSTGVLGTSLYIAFNAPSRLLGTGLGTQEQNHEKIAGQILTGTESFAELNKEDGYSLFTRILSELGMAGLTIYLFFILFCFNKRNYINVCAFYMIVCFFLRGGSYVDYGTVFMHFLYFYTSKKALNNDFNFDNSCHI